MLSKKRGIIAFIFRHLPFLKTMSTERYLKQNDKLRAGYQIIMINLIKTRSILIKTRY